MKPLCFPGCQFSTQVRKLSEECYWTARNANHDVWADTKGNRHCAREVRQKEWEMGWIPKRRTKRPVLWFVSPQNKEMELGHGSTTTPRKQKEEENRFASWCVDRSLFCPYDECRPFSI